VSAGWGWVAEPDWGWEAKEGARAAASAAQGRARGRQAAHEDGEGWAAAEGLGSVETAVRDSSAGCHLMERSC